MNEAKRCDLYHEQQDLLLEFRRPPLSKPHNPAIVMRELLPHGGWSRGPEGYTSVSLRNECIDANGKMICEPNVAARSLLKEYYPSVEVYSCNVHGKAVRLY